MPACVELSFLEDVKQLEYYGTEMYPVLTDEEDDNYLALSPTGVMVLHRNSLFAHYHWTHIIGVYKKGKYFMIKIFNKDNEKTTYGFELQNKKICKNLWKWCVEYQLFYKLIQAYFENTNNQQSTDGNQNRLDELTERFRSINLNELIVRRRKTMYNIFQSFIQHVNSLNKSSSAKDHLKTDQLTGINFTADEICQDNSNYDLDEDVRNEKSKPSQNNRDANHGQNKNEFETKQPSTLPNGFYLVNQQMSNSHLNATLNANIKSANNKRRPLNTYISTPGYSVEPTIANVKNRKCDSVFSLRSHRSRAAYSEMAYTSSADHRHKHNGSSKHCSHRRSSKDVSHRHKRRSSCSRHNGIDHRSMLENECASADEFGEDIFNNKNHHHHRRNRSRSYHTLCDETDHHHHHHSNKFKYFDEFDNEASCCTRSRHNRSHRTKRHRSCCLNELRYDSGQEEDEMNDPNDETASLCSSVHSQSKSTLHCKRRHRHRKESSVASKIEHPLKNDHQTIVRDDEQPKSIIKRSFKNLKLIDLADCEEEPVENVETDNQSDESELSYCSHHSRKSSRYSRACHRSRSKCCKHNHHHAKPSRCRHNHQHQHAESNSDLEHVHERSATRRRRKQMSCESLSDQEEVTDEVNKFDNETANQEKFYRSKFDQSQSGQLMKHSSLIVMDENKFMQPTEHMITKRIQKQPNLADQYLLPVQQFSNYPYHIDLNTNQTKYNTYRSTGQQQMQQNYAAQNNLPPNYHTLTNYMKTTSHFQPTNATTNSQIGLPAFYHHQHLNYNLKNNSQNGMYLTQNNSQIRNDNLMQQHHQVYQNLAEMPRFNSSSVAEVPQLPPRNTGSSQKAATNKSTQQPLPPPPLPVKQVTKPTIVNNKLNSDYKAQLLEDNSLYAKPSKLIGNKGSKNSNENENHLAQELDQAKQIQSLNSNNNSGDSANGSLQNINTLDSGISICSSTPTQDLNPGSNKSCEQSKTNLEHVMSSTMTNHMTSLNNHVTNSRSNSITNNMTSNIVTNHTMANLHQQSQQQQQQQKETSQSAADQNNYECNEQNGAKAQLKASQKPLEYYEINAEYNATANRSSRGVATGEFHPVLPKLKCYEISTEL